MEIPRTTDEQTPLWHGRAGHAWVALPEWLEPLFTPRADRLVAAVCAGAGGRVLAGGGTDRTTHAVARRLGTTGARRSQRK